MKMPEGIKAMLRPGRLVRGTLIFLALFSLTGYLILPPVVKSVAQKQLSEKLKREVTIQSVRIDPFLLSLTVRGVAIKEPGSSKIFASFEELYLNFQAMSLFKRGFIIREMRLQKPYVNIVRHEDHLYNFSDLLVAEKAKPSAQSKPPRFSVNNIQILGGSIDFFDGPKHVKHVIKDANMTIPFISDLPYYLDSYVQPLFSAKFNDHFVSFRGTVKPFVDSTETHLEVNVKDLNIPYYLAYVPFKMNFSLVSGLFDTQSSVSYVQYRDRPPLLSFKGTTTLRNILIRDSRETQVLSLPRMNIGISSSDIMERSIHFSKVSIESAEFNIVREKTGKMNILSLLPETEKESGNVPEKSAEAEKKKEDVQKPVIEADEILLTAGKVTFADLAENRNFRTVLDQVQCRINNFSTVKDKKTTVEVSLQTEAAEEIKFASSFSVEPLAAEGTVEAKQIVLKKYSPYYDRQVNFSVEDGRLDLMGRYQYQKAGNESDLGISGLQAGLNSLRLRKAGEQEDFLRVPVISIKDLSADLAKKQVNIDDISTRGGFILGKRYRIGGLLFATLLKVSEEVRPVKKDKAAGPGKTAAEKPWAVTVNKLLLEKYTVRFDDRMLEDPVIFTMGDVRVKGNNISTVKNAKGRISLSMKVEGKGEVQANGTVTIEPVSVKLNLVTRNMPIMPLQSYITDRINVYITGGSVSSEGSLSFSEQKNSSPLFGYTGSLAINQFATIDKNNAEDFLKWDSLHFSKIDIGYAPLSVNISEVALTDFYSRFVINQDGSLNLQNIMVKEGKKAEDTAEAEKKTVPPGAKSDQPQEERAKGESRPASAGKENAPGEIIKVGTVTLQGGTINFSDHYIKPNYSANFLEVGGRISGLSSEEDKMADVDLRGKLDNYAPLEISGKINPLRDDLYIDLKVDFRDMDLSPITPYSARYAGYTIEKGKLSLSLKYLIVKKKLDAQNRVFLDQLNLGEKVDSPDATKLPVKLAIALLKNRKGQIDLNLPVSGQLDDPKFSLGSVILKIIVNILVKAATSPFALLGAIFGGGEELSYLDFDYGSFVLNEPGTKKLDTLIKALNDRPALKLDIQGHVDIEKDREGLRQYLFNKKIKAQKLKEMVKSGKTAASVEDVKIEKDEYPKYLKMAYKAEKFPKPRNIVGIAKDLPGPEMEKLMLAHTEVKDDDLRMLASQRAMAVKDYIIKSKQVESERIFLVEPKSLQPEKKEKLKDSRVDFSLR